MRKIRINVVGISLLLALVAGACSSGKAPQAANPSGSSPAPTSPAGTAAGGGGVASGVGTAADCVQASVAFVALIAEPMKFLGGATQAELDKFAKDTQDLRAKIPSGIRGDFQTVADAYAAFTSELKGLNVSDFLNPATQARLQAASQKIEAGPVRDAQARVDAYFKTSCGN